MYLSYDIKLQIMLETMETSGFWRQTAKEVICF